MTSAIWWVIAAVVLIGHGGLHIALYNRINGFGFPRKVVKTIVKCFLLTTIAIPTGFLLLEQDAIFRLLSHGGEASELSTPLYAYGCICLLTWLILGVPWLIWRPIFGLEHIEAPRRTEVVDVLATVGRPLAISKKAQWQSQLPLNQLLDLSIEEIELPVIGLPEPLDGYRIAQVSDVHLTGDIHPDYAKYAMQRATQWQPDMIHVDRRYHRQATLHRLAGRYLCLGGRT